MYDRQPLAYFPSAGSRFDFPAGLERKDSFCLERQDTLSSVLNLLLDVEPLPFQGNIKTEVQSEEKDCWEANGNNFMYEEDSFDFLNLDATEKLQYPVCKQEASADEYTFNAKRKFVHESLEDDRKKGKWSKEEDVVLQEFAAEAQNKNGKIDFKRVCRKLKGRTPKQVREHWLSTLNPDLKKGRWTSEEEMQLIDLMIIHGKAWSTIARKIEGRAEHSVKAKGRLLLGERIKAQIHPPQSTAEHISEQRLLELHRQYGTRFEEISRQTGYNMSPAKIERELLHICNCNSCTNMTRLIKNSRSPDLHHGWTRIKAQQIKERLQRSPGSFYSPGPL